MLVQAPALYRHRTGHWLPADHAKVRGWVDRLLERKRPFEEKPLDPVLQNFKDFIDREPLVRRMATEMFKEIPVTPPYYKNPRKFNPQIGNYDMMFECINIILNEGPQWYRSDNPDIMGLIGFPINAILDWPMGTISGYQCFTTQSVNVHWKAVLDRWTSFLTSRQSLSVLDPGTGWLSADALQMLATKGNDGVDNYTFPELYQCDPTAPYYGFQSWDDFFTRKFRDAIRPISSPDGSVGSSTVIVNACESTPCFRKENVQFQDNFWLKSQPYSLADMLNGREKASPFEGGQVYQAFLSALSYHRWHAPVSGTVMSVENVAGTYYSQNYYEGFANIVDGEPRPDPNAPNKSQPYIAQVAARGIITIQADNEKVGLMAVVFIGMCEVSSCEFFVEPGDRINKGDCIGTFHFGGSSHCLVFRPETKLKFDDPGPYDNEDNNKKVNSFLALVV